MFIAMSKVSFDSSLWRSHHTTLFLAGLFTQCPFDYVALFEILPTMSILPYTTHIVKLNIVPRLSTHYWKNRLQNCFIPNCYTNRPIQRFGYQRSRSDSPSSSNFSTTYRSHSSGEGTSPVCGIFSHCARRTGSGSLMPVSIRAAIMERIY